MHQTVVIPLQKLTTGYPVSLDTETSVYVGQNARFIHNNEIWYSLQYGDAIDFPAIQNIAYTDARCFGLSLNTEECKRRSHKFLKEQ